MIDKKIYKKKTGLPKDTLINKDTSALVNKHTNTHTNKNTNTMVEVS